jgi:glycosyltransferase involved in cell wall biosynthesis
MRILLASNASYAPPRGGSTRSNLAWLRHLVAAGHQCRVIGASIDAEDHGTVDGGLPIRCVHDLARRSGVVAEEIGRFRPDWVLVSSEDVSHSLLREAAHAAPERIVYLAHTPQFFPFGPESWNPHGAALHVVHNARAVVAIGHHMAAYIRRYAGVNAAVIHPPIYGRAPWPQYSNFDGGWVTMINPCQVKGITIFSSLAERFPDRQFAALIGWGTTAADKQSLSALPNVRLLASVPSIDEVLSNTAVLLMPSLWYEGFGLIAMEAMLRGLPVISSDSGGLVEAKQGTDYVIPVRPIERYLPEFDETHMPKPMVPEQDLAPWTDALGKLLTNAREYSAESAQCRWVAERFVSRLRAADFEDLLLSLKPAEQRIDEADEQDRLERLSAAKRELLLKRLRDRGQR